MKYRPTPPKKSSEKSEDGCRLPTFSWQHLLPTIAPRLSTDAAYGSTPAGRLRPDSAERVVMGTCPIPCSPIHQHRYFGMRQHFLRLAAE
jgi:hypothetical protein